MANSASLANLASPTIVKPLPEQNLKNYENDQDKICDQANSMANSASLANSVDLGWQFASPANSASLANFTSPTETNTPTIVKPLESQAILATLNPAQGFLKVPNWILDSLPTIINSNEQLMYIHLYRLSHGFGKNQCLASLDKLAERTGFSKRTVQTVLQSLETKGLITKIGHNFGKGIIQGTIFRVATIASLANSASPAETTSLATVTTIKDHHDDLKKHDHHQSEHEKNVMMIYQKITGNNWSKADIGAYNKIKNIPIEAIEMALRMATERAATHPNSFAYFIKEILNTANPPKQNRTQIKKALEKIVDRLRNSFVGSSYTPSDFIYKVKDLCVRDGVAFDNDLVDELLAKKNK